MILALTGAGISCASGIPTFEERPGIRDTLSRDFAERYPKEYGETIQSMQKTCQSAEPNDAHFALAEYGIPVITMNIDELHQRAGSEHVLPIHGTLPDIVLYGDPAPLYQEALAWVHQLRAGDFFLIIGTSYYTNISAILKFNAIGCGADVIEINENAEHQVRVFLSKAESTGETFAEFMEREAWGAPVKRPYQM